MSYLRASLIPSTAIVAFLGSFPAFAGVGYKVLDLQAPGKEQGRAVTVAVWYPTGVEGMHRSDPYIGRPRMTDVWPDAKPQQGRHPFFLASHGYGGGGTSLYDLAEELARNGFIVASPDHNDPDQAVRIRKGRQKIHGFRFLRHVAKLVKSGRDFDFAKYRYRLDEAELVLDAMLANDLFGKLIDAKRIGAGGHSFGGYTTLGLAGAVPGRRDQRIGALVLLSPGIFMYDEAAFRRVKVRILYMLGEHEAKKKREDTTKLGLGHRLLAAHDEPDYFALIRGFRHQSFGSCIGDSRRCGTEQDHALINRYVVAFLKHYLNHDAKAGRLLHVRDAAFVEYSHPKQKRNG